MGFPGIFASIDAYTKNIIERYFQKNGRFPEWLSDIGSAKKIVSVKPSEFKVKTDNITITGIPDLLFERSNGSFAIVDYKTAKYTGNQDQLMPVYQIQLNGYAYIAEAIELKPVKDLYLVYFEPPYKETYEAITDGHTNGEGFEMPFKPVIHKIKIEPNRIGKLLEKAGEIYRSEKLPERRLGCKDCEKLNNLINMLSIR